MIANSRGGIWSQHFYHREFIENLAKFSSNANNKIQHTAYTGTRIKILLRNYAYDVIL